MLRVWKVHSCYETPRLLESNGIISARCGCEKVSGTYLLGSEAHLQLISEDSLDVQGDSLWALEAIKVISGCLFPHVNSLIDFQTVQNGPCLHPMPQLGLAPACPAPPKGISSIANELLG